MSRICYPAGFREFRVVLPIFAERPETTLFLTDIAHMVPLTSFFDAFSKVNVLVVGDVMIDRYLTGRVSRVSPEAPVPVVHLSDRENRLGGAANVALNLRALGATPYLCGVVGVDDNADIFTSLLPEQGLSDRGIYRSPERVTTVKTRILASNQHLLRVDQEDSHDLTDTEANAFLEYVRNLIDQRDIHVILFQDYNKGVLTQRVIQELILEAIKRDIPTAVDPKEKNFWSYKHVTLFKPNLKEIRAQVPMPIEPTLESLREASDYVQKQLGNASTIITLSEKGLYYKHSEGDAIVPTLERSVADVCGAGDTVISIVAMGLALDLPIDQIAVLANLAGGQVCERVGVVPVNREQLQREFNQLMQLSK